jgi:glycosyltransferase involved in cell wall biosynthesis
MVILFVTRKFPPSKGGMQRVAYELSRHLSKIADVKLVKWGGSNKWLPLVLPFLLLQSLWILISSKVEVIYLQDGLLAPLGILLKPFRVPIAITFHGRDITYDNKLYQFLIPRCAEKLDRIICISDATKQQCVKRGISENKTVVIPDGICDEFRMDEGKQELRERLSKELGRSLNDKKVLLSVGRLVERKGFHWLVESVIPKLLEREGDVLYLIAGDGTFRQRIETVIRQRGLQDHILMLGIVDDETLKTLYNVSDIFVMPNISVKGDMEGFGVVALEAASCGLPVGASNLEGIKDAIKDTENGFLVEPYNLEGFVNAVTGLLEKAELRKQFGARSREFTLKNFAWENIAGRYLEEFKSS